MPPKQSKSEERVNNETFFGLNLMMLKKFEDISIPHVRVLLRNMNVMLSAIARHSWIADNNAMSSFRWILQAEDT